MPAPLKPEWLARLRAVDPQAELRFNELVGRWEFALTSGDGKLRSQFWGQYYRTDHKGRRIAIEPDVETGLYPFRDLDDDGIEEACQNLERTFVGNPHDGAGSTRKDIERRIAFNATHKRKQYREAGELFADMVADRGRRIRGEPLIHVPITLHK